MISIQYEDSFLIVLSKPHGVSVHNEEPSLQTWLKNNQKPIHFANRIDTDTSGLILIAKNPEDQNKLQIAMAEGEKKYRALLRTGWKLTTTHFKWDQPLSDKAEGYRHPQGLKADLKPCLTLGEVVRTNKYFTEIVCSIKTGRQHQIRKHSALAHHPIVGDSRYNEKKYNQNIFKIYNVNRMFLHSESLSFNFKNKDYQIEDKNFNLDLFFK